MSSETPPQETPLAGRVTTELRPAEERFLRAAASDAGAQAYLRALLLIASEDDALAAQASELAGAGKRLGEPGHRTPGTLRAERVREAVEAERSLSGAARALGAHRSSVRRICAAEGIHVPSMGRVPEQLEKYR